MIAATDIQNAYINLYKEMQKYIWSAETIENLADLEVSVYETFPDMNVIRKNFKQLKYDLYDILRSDDKDESEPMKEVVDRFENTLNDEVGYGRIEKVQEAI